MAWRAAHRLQAGRAGRGQKDALIVMVTYNSPVDQFYARNPQKLFKGDPEVRLCKCGMHAVVERE